MRPELLPLLQNPTEGAYNVTRRKLMVSYALGDREARDALLRLDRLYYLLRNYDLFAALYGPQFASARLLKELDAIVPAAGDTDASRLEMLIRLYEEDNAYLRPLVDALLDLKVRIADRAPENLMKLIDDTIAAADSSKKNVFIRRAQIVLSYVKMLEQEGAEVVSRAIDVLLNRQSFSGPAPAPTVPPLKPPGDAEVLNILKYVADVNASGRPAPKDELFAMFDNPVAAAAVIRRATSSRRPLLVHDKKAGGFVITTLGLQDLSRDGLITKASRAKVVNYLKTTNLVPKLIERGVIPDFSALDREGGEGEEEEAGEEDQV